MVHEQGACIGFINLFILIYIYPISKSVYSPRTLLSSIPIARGLRASAERNYLCVSGPVIQLMTSHNAPLQFINAIVMLYIHAFDRNSAGFFVCDVIKYLPFDAGKW